MRDQFSLSPDNGFQHQHHSLGKPQPLTLRIAAEGQSDLWVVFVEPDGQPCHALFTGDLYTTALLRALTQKIGLSFPELKMVGGVQRSSTCVVWCTHSAAQLIS